MDSVPAKGVPPVDGIRTGVGGWTYAPWRDTFYPAGLVQRRELEYASRRLAAIEINGTYYRAQKPATYARWRDETPPGFVFSAKAPRRITHSRALAGTGPQIAPRSATLPRQWRCTHCLCQAEPTLTHALAHARPASRRARSSRRFRHDVTT